MTTGSTAFLGPAGLLSDKAREMAAGAGAVDSLWSAISSFFGPKEELVVKQAKMVKGWDRLDYRADGFEPFCFIENHAVYLRFGKRRIEFVLLIDDQPVDIYLYFPAKDKRTLPAAVALLVRFYVAATQEDYKVQRDEEQVLLTLRKTLQLDKELLNLVKSLVMERVLWLMMDDLRLDVEEKEIASKLGQYLRIDGKERKLAAQRAVVARAAMLVKSKELNNEAIKQWSSVARAEGVDKNRVISTVQALRRAYFSLCCRSGELPVVHSSTAPLRPGEVLHFAARARVFTPLRGPEKLVVRTIGSRRDPVLSMMFEAEPVGGSGKLKQVDGGSFYLTSQRMILVGRKGTTSSYYEAMKKVYRFRKGIRIDSQGPAGFRYYEIDEANEAFAIVQALRGL